MRWSNWWIHEWAHDIYPLCLACLYFCPAFWYFDLTVPRIEQNMQCKWGGFLPITDYFFESSAPSFPRLNMCHPILSHQILVAFPLRTCFIQRYTCPDNGVGHWQIRWSSSIVEEGEFNLPISSRNPWNLINGPVNPARPPRVAGSPRLAILRSTDYWIVLLGIHFTVYTHVMDTVGHGMGWQLLPL